MLSSRYLLYGLLLIFIFRPSVYSQNAAECSLITMEEAIERALHVNNQVRASAYAVERAGWDKTHAWTKLFPVVSFNTRYTWIDDSTFALRDFSRYFQDPNLPFQVPQTVFQNAFYTSFNLSLPVFNPLLFNGISQANLNEDLAQDLNTSTRRSIIFQVISTCLEILKRKEIYEFQQEYLELSRLNYEKAERLFKAGRFSKTDALRWKVDYQQQMSIVKTSESNLRSGRITLSRLLNAAKEESFEVENRIPSYLLEESEKLLQLSDIELLAMIQLETDELIKLNASLSAAKKTEELNQSAYRNSYNAYLPVVDLTYSHAWRENSTLALDDYSPKTLMVNLSVPVFTSFQNFTRLKSSYYAYRESQENFHDQLQNLRYILTETTNRLINLRTQRELSKVNVEFSERNYRIVEQQKEKGLVSNIEFIDAKLNLQNARLSDISNYYDFISNMVELYYLLGKIEGLISIHG